jgi:hypothetical protein
VVKDAQLWGAVRRAANDEVVTGVTANRVVLIPAGQGRILIAIVSVSTQ